MGKRLERSSRRPEEPVCVSVDIFEAVAGVGEL